MKGITTKRRASSILICMTVLFFASQSAVAALGGGWENHITLYGWYAGIDGNVKFPDGSGSEVKVEASDILESLNLMFMGNYEGRYNRWSLVIDGVYLDVGEKDTTTTALGSASVDLNVSSWVVHGGVGYDFIYDDDKNLGVIGGVRYLSLDADIEAGLQGARGITTSENESLTDGFIGIRGQFACHQNWYLPYYADIGAGGSDLSYQLYAAIGYRYKWFDVRLGYRHLYFDLGDDRFMEDLQISGPALGVGFRF
ncbi:MAG: hypothetical protein P8X86_14695 [Desulfofustis sp.]|jgi:hypothetical protein